MTVNGKFPGPRIVAREGDRLLIKVINHVQSNISIHWYGVSPNKLRLRNFIIQRLSKLIVRVLLLEIGMEFDNFKVDGLMGQDT